MEENRLHILNESIKVISKLQLLSVFFQDDMIFKVYLRTQVIHQIYEGNPDLDIGKLELFHIQFTETVIDMLRKIKQANEKNVSLLYDELQINRDLISNLNNAVYTEKSFAQDAQRQALKIGLSLRKLYQALSEDSAEYPFSTNLGAFSARYASDFFYDLLPELFNQITTYAPEESYRNAYAVIQRRLLGQLHKIDFRVSFFCGLKSGNQVMEVYRFAEGDKFFLYLVSGSIFLFVDHAVLDALDTKNAVSKKAALIRELSDKDTRLESSIGAAKTLIPPALKNLLSEYYKKISDIDFLQRSDFEIQANILKTMLNTDSI